MYYHFCYNNLHTELYVSPYKWIKNSVIYDRVKISRLGRSLQEHHFVRSEIKLYIALLSTIIVSYLQVNNTIWYAVIGNQNNNSASHQSTSHHTAAGVDYFLEQNAPPCFITHVAQSFTS